jgi:hypothetical protein
MKKTAFTIWVGMGIAVACAPDDPAGQQELQPGEAQTADAEFGRLNPLAPPETEHWGRLAGVWSCTIPTTTPDGAPGQSRATWTWRYILDGHAVQDVYVGHRGQGQPDFYGTGVRIYHPGTETWEISWIANSPSTGIAPRITRFTATSEGGDIVMRRAEGDPEWRVVFHDIGDDTFAWRSEPSGQTMTCAR